jgi:hypothetical protein
LKDKIKIVIIELKEKEETKKNVINRWKSMTQISIRNDVAIRIRQVKCERLKLHTREMFFKVIVPYNGFFRKIRSY